MTVNSSRSARTLSPFKQPVNGRDVLETVFVPMATNAKF